MIKAELLSIGDELLIGQVVNTNVSTIGKLLCTIGIDTHRVTTVGDNKKDLLRAIKRAWKESDVVIATGGLGPTHDDISKKIVADFFGKKLVRHEPTLRQVRARFRKFGYATMPVANIGQADIPQGFTPLRNDQGTAPGLWYKQGKKVFIILPGVPHEMSWLMDKWVIPKLRKQYKDKASGVILHKVLHTSGVGESSLAEMIGDPQKFLGPGATLAYLPRIGGVRLRITVKSNTQAAAKKILLGVEKYIRAQAKQHIYGDDDVTLEETVVDLLLKKKQSVATAESCTAGMFAARLTNVPGATGVFPGGIVSYANEIKEKELNVPAKILKHYGAVSEETAILMAEHIRRKFGSTIGISITGIAGPTGGTKTKPVGTVWVALAQKGKKTKTQLLHNVGDRAMIRERSVEFALEFLRRALIEG